MAVARFHAPGRRPLPAAPAARPGRRRPPLQPRPLRRRAHDDGLRRAPPRRGRRRPPRGPPSRPPRAELCTRPASACGCGRRRGRRGEADDCAGRRAVRPWLRRCCLRGVSDAPRGKAGGLSLIILLAAYVPYAGVGSILVARRPRNVIGWVLLGMGWTFAVSFLPIDATAHELQTLTASPLAMTIAWLTEVDGVTHVRPVRYARFLLSDRQARARSLAADRRPRAGAGLGERDRLGVLAGVCPGSDRRREHRRVPEPDRPPATKRSSGSTFRRKRSAPPFCHSSSSRPSRRSPVATPARGTWNACSCAGSWRRSARSRSPFPSVS